MKMPEGQGTYIYEDGHTAWYYALSFKELRNKIQIHGKVIRYIPGR